MFEEFKATLRKDPVESSTRAGLRDRFAEVRRLLGALEVYEARLMTATDSLGDNGLDGAGMKRSVGRASSRAAAKSAKRAKKLEQLPKTRDALQDGDITAEHADSIVDAAEKVSPEQADAELVEPAKTAPADVAAKRAQEWAAENRDDDGADELTRQRRNRSGAKWVQKSGDKMHVFRNELDRVDGETVAALIEGRYQQLWRDDGGRSGDPDERRSREQRMADAFVSLITGAAVSNSAGNGTMRPHPKTQLNVVYDIAGKTTADGRPLASMVIDGKPLPQTVLDRLACGSTITPMIFNGPGQPIWVGRDYRHATAAQWKALIARDRGCVGCAAAVNRCEAHHIVAWDDLGSTDITNLVLVCSRCHHDIHDRGMALKRTNGRWHIEPRHGPAPNHSHRPDGQLPLAS